ncbi:gp38, partial [Listeria monocytogenes FSL F2-208]
MFQKSISAPTAMQILAETRTQKELAIDSYVTPALISNQLKGKRTVSLEQAEQLIDSYNEPESTYLFAHEFSNGMIPPLFDGLDNHHASLTNRFELEVEEAINTLKNGLETMTYSLRKGDMLQREAAKQAISEITDVVASALTL